jgi:hypothetical protein
MAAPSPSSVSQPLVWNAQIDVDGGVHRLALRLRDDDSMTLETGHVEAVPRCLVLPRVALERLSNVLRAYGFSPTAAPVGPPDPGSVSPAEGARPAPAAAGADGHRAEAARLLELAAHEAYVQQLIDRPVARPDDGTARWMLHPHVPAAIAHALLAAPAAASAEGGAWICHYNDWSGIAIFGDELSALRHATEHNMVVGFCPWGEVR